MKNIDLIRRILATPTPGGLVSALNGRDVAQEIFDISKFDDRQLVDFTGTSGPSQFKSIMVVCRLAPRDVILSLVVECTLHVLPVATAAYPNEGVLAQFALLKSSSTMFIRQEMAAMRESIDQLYRRSNADEEESRSQKFDQLGYVPLEWGQEVGRASSAICVLTMATVIVTNEDSTRFARNVDGTMCALRRVFPDDTEKLGKWMVAKLSQLVEAHP